jgi:hypothetical protein
MERTPFQGLFIKALSQEDQSEAPEKEQLMKVKPTDAVKGLLTGGPSR